MWLRRVSELAGGGFTFQSTVLDALRTVDSAHEFIPIVDQGLREPPPGALVFGPGGGAIAGVRGRAMRLLGRRCREQPTLESFLERPPRSTALDAFVARHRIDVMYYPAPGWMPSAVPFVVTIWDLAHRIYPFFPELSTPARRWNSRERLYAAALPRAAYVVTGTEAGKQQIARCYQVHPDRIRVIPMPARRPAAAGPLPACVDERWPYRASYLFYPAQFWPHKNHVRLLEALSILAQRGMNLGLVLTGSDQGNRARVEGRVRALGLEDRVVFAGFVDERELTALYANAAALVFPSYFGPDNLPPLEAMMCRCPVIASDIEGAREQLGDAAVYFDPSDAGKMAEAIAMVAQDPAVRERLVSQGDLRVRSRTPEEYGHRLVELFDDFRSLSSLWR